MHKKNTTIGILTLPNPPAGERPLQNFIDIMSSLATKIYLITGALDREKLDIKFDKYKCECFLINYLPKRSVFLRILNNIFLQFKYSFYAIKCSKNVSCWMFFFGERGPLLPLIITKILRKKSFLILCGSTLKMSNYVEDRLSFFSIALERCCHYISDKLIIYSKNLIKEWSLDRYKRKILIAHEHFLDFGRFRITRKYHKRVNLIGYIGRLSGEKGIVNFIEAVKILLNDKDEDEYDFIIGGDGDLRGYVDDYIEGNRLNEKMKLLGWIQHDDLPVYLNQLKLLILPSYTEGLPNIMLEAMACGTPVLATPVGAIPDVIKDGETGFLLQNNTPEHIAEKIEEILNMPPELLEKISENARTFVENEFTFEKTVERWKKIFDEV